MISMVLAITLAGCSKIPSCSDDDVADVLKSIANDMVKSYDKDGSASARMKFHLSTVRTDSVDKEARKAVCRAEIAGSTEKSSDEVKAEIVYSAQATDDGQLYVEVLDGDFRGVVYEALHMAKTELLDEKKATEAQTPAAVSAAAIAPAASAPAADGTYTEAAPEITQLLPTDCDLQCAAMYYRESDRDLTVAYAEAMARLPAGKQAQLEAEQKTWLDEKESKCAFPIEQAEMSCKAELTLQRVQYVKSWR